MLKTEHYIPPPEHVLNPYVHSIFSARGELVKEHISPKGVLDIIFNFGDPMESELFGRVQAPDTWQKVLFCGLRTESMLSVPNGSVNIIGVTLHASFSRELIHIPLHEMTDQLIDATLIFPETSELWNCMGETPEFSDRCEILLTWLQSLLMQKEKTPFIIQACRQLQQIPEGKTMDKVSQISGLSNRQIRRLFNQYVGITPGRYMKIARFIKAIQLMNTDMTLTEIAHHSHYYDQAHFCRDFTDMAKISPREYRSLIGPVPGHIFYH